MIIVNNRKRLLEVFRQLKNRTRLPAILLTCVLMHTYVPSWLFGHAGGHLFN